jgi:hypothetical protein
MQLALRTGALRAAREPGAATTSRPVLLGVVALSVLTGWVHLAYVAPHFRAWWAYGVFFLVVGLGQGLLGAALLRWPSAWVALAGIAGNLGVVVMYVISRSSGVPLGPHAGVVEKATTIDLLTTGAEIVLVVVLLTMLGRIACRLAMNVILLLGVLLWVGRLTDHLP